VIVPDKALIVQNLSGKVPAEGGDLPRRRRCREGRWGGHRWGWRKGAVLHRCRPGLGSDDRWLLRRSRPGSHRDVLRFRLHDFAGRRWGRLENRTHRIGNQIRRGTAEHGMLRLVHADLNRLRRVAIQREIDRLVRHGDRKRTRRSASLPCGRVHVGASGLGFELKGLGLRWRRSRLQPRWRARTRAAGECETCHAQGERYGGKKPSTQHTTLRPPI
jgi:hypothetical protein